MRFKDRDIEAFWIDSDKFKPRRVPPELRKPLFRKLQMMDAAEASGSLNDLRVPPGNRLECLEGDRAGRCSIRVNRQWRLCFTWTTSGIEGVELVDYH
ncbi:type II toxin-antitoxin system RelE/ParE family toxin [Gordonibacter massiliensis (ex Traore et al. 2017)]|uniref:type II toxin-antitoxin system RelE/ParE family toxin n=1 Tax=Gordonibacter massiliensis (ex Traore et al. 2017) TaxID=1841863 RepID=UPI001C8C9AFD|nr:type II toxin-antitoxin system RelE/ParE family toxin [Gordonibacter massiliensis (ex Traore et al. 2017)]MBX9035287.1 type II toxin-antitoxin system RelE/ParE family toxin [Gordonibacter massiliensis (ex Traore et al. 2017)]